MTLDSGSAQHGATTGVSAHQDFQNIVEWPIYPEESYRFENNDEAAAPKLLRPPCCSPSISAWVNSRLSVFLKEGMQHSVAAIIVAHKRCSPRVLLLEGERENDKPSTSLSLEPALPSLHRFTLPTFRCERWERPSTVLEQHLSSFIRHRVAGDELETNEGTTHVQSPSTLASTALSFDTQSDSGPQSGAETSNVSPLVESIAAQSACNGDDAWTLQCKEPAAPQQVAQSVPEETSHRGMAPGIVGSLLAVWWVPEFGTPPLPFIPSHITRPKEQIYVYQVVLPGDCDICTPPGLNIRFMPFEFFLHQQHSTQLPQLQCLGASYLGLPSLLSRFALIPMVFRPSEEYSTDSSHNATRFAPSARKQDDSDVGNAEEQICTSMST